MKVYIMRGASGSGKTTWAESFLNAEEVNNRKRVLRLSTDLYFMKKGKYEFNPALLPTNHNFCLRDYLAALQENIMDIIVVDNTNTRMYELAPYYRLAEVFNYTVEVIWMLAPVQTCIDRNTHNVPEATIRQMVAGAEPLPAWWNIRQVWNG